MRERNRKLKVAAGPKPERTCIACMKRDSKSAMIRIAVVNGKVEADFAARQPGVRGIDQPHAIGYERVAVKVGLERIGGQSPNTLLVFLHRNTL